MDFIYKPPEFLKHIFPDIIWENSTHEILITIDDGPSENTYRILDILDKFKLKAVFFCTGKNIEKHYNEFTAILKAGHQIENHSYSHKRLIFRDRKFNFEQIEKTSNIIFEQTGKLPELFRPPYGFFNLNTIRAAEKSGLKIMIWTLLSGDHTGDFSNVRRLIDMYLKKSSILVLHDNKRASDIFEQSIELVIKTAQQRNFKFAVPEY